MGHTLTYTGSRLLSLEGISGMEVEVGLFNNATNNEGDDIGPEDSFNDITTEPDETIRLDISVTDEDIEQMESGWYGVRIQDIFDTTGISEEETYVDSTFIVTYDEEEDPDKENEILVGTGNLELENTDYLDLVFIDKVDFESTVTMENQKHDDTTS